MENQEEIKIACKVNDDSGQPIQMIAWKYKAMREAILSVVPEQGEGISFRDLRQQAKEALTGEQRANLGSAGWYTMTVKKDLEARGLIHAVPDSKPERLLAGPGPE